MLVALVLLLCRPLAGIIIRQSERIYTSDKSLYEVNPFALLCNNMQKESCIQRPIQMLSDKSFELNSFYYHSWSVGFLLVKRGAEPEEIPFFRLAQPEAILAVQAEEEAEVALVHKTDKAHSSA